MQQHKTKTIELPEQPRYDREKRWIEMLLIAEKIVKEKESIQRLKDAAIVKAAMGKLHGGGNARRILQEIYNQILNQ